MFVPLPVPFVFQRTAPDLNAWRLKSPLALRSNSGKTSFFFFLPSLSLFSLLHILHVGQTRARPCRPAPPLHGADALAAGRAVGAHTHLDTHTHSSGSFWRLLQSPLQSRGGCSIQKKLPSARRRVQTDCELNA